MTGMTDPLASLYALIKNGWALTDTDLDTIGNKKKDSAKDIHLTTGWYDDNLQTPQITITPTSGVANHQVVGGANVGERELYDIGVWVQIERSTSKGEGYAKTVLHKLNEEVKRIIMANKTLTDTYDLGLYDWRWIPEPELEAPVLHYVLTVKIEYFQATS